MNILNIYLGFKSVLNDIVLSLDQPMRGGWRGSMPELRKNVTCCTRSGHHFHKMGHFTGSARSKTIEGADSGDSTEELLDEAEHFIRNSIDCMSSSKVFQGIAIIISLLA